MIERHKKNRRQEEKTTREEKIQKLAELEEKYKIALQNASNQQLVAEYEHFIAVKKDYETYRNELSNQFDVDKAIQEITQLIAEYRVANFGVDPRDVTKIKTEVSILRQVVGKNNVSSSESVQGSENTENERQM